MQTKKIIRLLSNINVGLIIDFVSGILKNPFQVMIVYSKFLFKRTAVFIQELSIIVSFRYSQLKCLIKAGLHVGKLLHAQCFKDVSLNTNIHQQFL